MNTTREDDRMALAAIAMHGLLSSGPLPTIIVPERVASSAVQLANALIAELEKPHE